MNISLAQESEKAYKLKHDIQVKQGMKQMREIRKKKKQSDDPINFVLQLIIWKV